MPKQPPKQRILLVDDHEVVRLGLKSLLERHPQFDVVGEADGVVVVDDYAHHPTAIRATLSAAKSAGFRRIFAVFQPHRYTRTMHFMEDFARAFNLADVVLLLDIYPAGEAPIDGVTTPALVEKIKSFGHKNAIHAPDYESIESYLAANAVEGDAVIVMGAGSVTKLSDLLAARLFIKGAS